MIDCFGDVGKILVGYFAHIAPLWQVLPDELVGVFVFSALPRGIGIGEEDGDAGASFDVFELGELSAVIQCQGLAPTLWDMLERPDGLVGECGGISVL